MSNKLYLWLGLFGIFIISPFFHFIGDREFSQIFSIMGAMTLCIYGINTCEEESQTKGVKDE